MCEITFKRGSVKETDIMLDRDVLCPLKSDMFGSSASDIHSLFAKFNKLYFWGKLDGVKLEWSNRMTCSAGIFYGCPWENNFCIRLSRPLLTQRSYIDLVETLLHEMIHAYQSVTRTRDYDDSGGHGSKFHEHMHRINKAAGLNISVYHTFYREIQSLQQHWWRCDGPCKSRKPFFGWVKRANNRAPGPRESWWRRHSINCGGRFVKVKEPAEYTKKRVKGLFDLEDDTSIPKISLNSFGFESLTSGNQFAVETNEKVTSLSLVNTKDRKVIKNDSYCPICLTKTPNEFLPEHLKTCNDLQNMFKKDPIDFDNVSTPDYDSDSECDSNPGSKSDSDICEEKISSVVVSTDQKVTNKDLICPICLTKISQDFLSQHLKSCNDLQNVFDEDPFGFGEDISDVSRKSDVVICPGPVCDIVDAPKDPKKKSKHEVYDVSSPSFEEFTSPVVVSSDLKVTHNDLYCPICLARVSKELLSEHLKTCNDLTNLLNEVPIDFGEVGSSSDLNQENIKCSQSEDTCSTQDFSSVCGANALQSETIVNEKCIECLVCGMKLRHISINDHLDVCDGLKGIFDDDVIIIEEGRKCNNNDCNDDRRFSNLYIPRSADHFTMSLRSYDKDVSKPNTTRVKTFFPNKDPGAKWHGTDLKICPICGLELRSDITSHLKNDCLSNVDELMELELPYLTDTSKLKQPKNPDTVNEVNCLRSSDCGIKKDCFCEGPSTNAVKGRRKPSEIIPEDDSESLIYCRGCLQFYSTSLCPVCCTLK